MQLYTAYFYFYRQNLAPLLILQCERANFHVRMVKNVGRRF